MEETSDAKTLQCKRMKCNEEKEKKWCKFNHLINKDPDAEIVLFSVPRGFPIQNLNSF